MGLGPFGVGQVIRHRLDVVQWDPRIDEYIGYCACGSSFVLRISQGDGFADEHHVVALGPGQYEDPRRTVASDV